MQTITYRMDGQQGPTVQHKELYIQCPGINRNGKEYKRECVLCITESLCCTAETDTL